MIISSQFRGRTLETTTVHLCSNQTIVTQTLNGVVLLSEVFAGALSCQEIAKMHEDAKQLNGMVGP